MTSKKWNQDAVMKLLQKKKEEDNSSFTDQRFWTVPTPKKGENVYRIRFLPSMSSGGEYSVRILKHGFQAPSGNWVIENCPKTLDKYAKCPIDEYATPFFNTGDPKDKEFASKLYNKKNFIANILVIKDPRNNGENEGKVFLFRYGIKIHEKLDTALFPPADSGLEQVMFIDPYKGYDLNLVVKIQKDGSKEYSNYDNSVFVRESTPIAKTEEEIDKILESCYDLSEFIAPKNFKSYDELKKILDDNVVNFRKGGDTSPKKEEKREEPKKETPTKKEEPTAQKKEEKKVESTPDSDDEFLKSLEAELNK